MKELLEKELNLEILDIQAVSGGDINRAYKLNCSNKSLFLKTNQRPRGAEMLNTEFNALKRLYRLDSSFAPQPYHYFVFQDAPCLIMEYIAPHTNKKLPTHQVDVAKVLLKLHTHKGKKYGWSEHNFIGALPQYNNVEEEDLSWPHFYWQYRILPQIEIAIEKKYFNKAIKNIESDFIGLVSSFYNNIQSPTLTHGDLWAGNYLIDTNGKARLIDPALCYSHPDMDIAMSMLFGGFGPEFYSTYKKNCDIELASFSGHEDVFQLYYLLVHLNLFGTGYLDQCNGILRKYDLIF